MSIDTDGTKILVVGKDPTPLDDLMERIQRESDRTSAIPNTMIFRSREEYTRREIYAHQRFVKPKMMIECALPGCKKMTTHNGGYCCADHCQEHRGRNRK